MSLDVDSWPVVEDYGTGLLRTTIRSTSDGRYLWLRHPGPSAPEPFAPVGMELAEALTGVGELDGGRPVVGEEYGHGRLYRVGGRDAVAARLLREGPTSDLEEPLRGVGRVLRAVHALPASAAPSQDGPRAWRRLTRWLEGNSGSGRAEQASLLLRTKLGDERWERLRGWCETSFLGAHEEVVLAHGAPGLGSVVVDADGSCAEVLTGEDVCVAAWSWDLGWVIGELVEFRMMLGGGADEWQPLIAALQEGYGRGLGRDWIPHAARRIALHVHDYTAYVTLTPQEIQRYGTALAFLVDQ